MTDGVSDMGRKRKKKNNPECIAECHLDFSCDYGGVYGVRACINYPRPVPNNWGFSYRGIMTDRDDIDSHYATGYCSYSIAYDPININPVTVRDLVSKIKDRLKENRLFVRMRDDLNTNKILNVIDWKAIIGEYLYEE